MTARTTQSKVRRGTPAFAPKAVLPGTVPAQIVDLNECRPDKADDMLPGCATKSNIRGGTSGCAVKTALPSTTELRLWSACEIIDPRESPLAAALEIALPTLLGQTTYRTSAKGSLREQDGRFESPHFPKLEEESVNWEELLVTDAEGDKASRRQLWTDLGGLEFEESEALKRGKVLLLSAKWLIKTSESFSTVSGSPALGTLQPRQMLPSTAYMSLSQVQSSLVRFREGCTFSLPLVCVSHCWLQPNHPDPHGYNLRILAASLRLMVRQMGVDVAVFFDFPSLHQGCRDADGIACQTTFEWSQEDKSWAQGAIGRYLEEEEAFGKALGDLGLFYAHKSTYVFMLTGFPEGYTDDIYKLYPLGQKRREYFQRGWCFAEASCATLLKPSTLVLDLQQARGTPATFASDATRARGSTLVGSCAARRMAPMTTHLFDDTIDGTHGEEGKSFTNGSTDTRPVKDMYKAAYRRFQDMRELDYSGLSWSEEETRGVRDVLVSGVSGGAPQLQILNFKNNRLGDGGANAVAAALMSGKVPNLTRLDLSENNVSCLGVQALAKSLSGVPKLKKLCLAHNSIRDDGVCALVDFLPKVCSLRVLSLTGNKIGDRGATALCRAVETLRKLRSLKLTDNCIHDAGAQSLASAFPPRSVQEEIEVQKKIELWLDWNCITDEGKNALAEAGTRMQKLTLHIGSGPNMLARASVTTSGSSVSYNATRQQDPLLDTTIDRRTLGPT